MEASVLGHNMLSGRPVGVLLTVLCYAPSLLAQSNSSEIQAHYKRAREAIAQHDLERATQEYAEILKLDPRNADVHAAQGATLYGMGKPAQAATALQTALTLDPGQTSAELFLGLSKSDLGQCADAVPLLRKHFNERTEPKLRRMVGLSLLNCYGGSSDLDQALELARSLKKSYPEDADVLYNLAEVYSQLLNGTVDELLKKRPDSYRVHQLAGETLEAQGQNEQAIKEYRKALEINPKVSRLHYRIGRLILLDGRGPDADREAVSHFQQELALNPGDAASEYQIGEVVRKKQQYEEARKHFTRALELASNFVEPRIGLARIDAATHQPEKALADLREALRLQPGNSSGHYALMMVYRDLGKIEDASRELAIFRKLEAEKEKDFRSQLQSLLTGKAASAEKPRE